MSEVKFLQCKHCGNIATVLYNAGPAISCCGEKMVEMVAGTTDAALEKHVPAVTRDGNKVSVQVGSVEHPMTDDHYITFIAAVQGANLQVAQLTPADAPKAEFVVGDGPVEVYEFCNLHGLWKTEA